MGRSYGAGRFRVNTHARHRAEGALRTLTGREPAVYGRPGMRARSGDPPRTMAQKILFGRSNDPTLRAPRVQAKVDQIVLATGPQRAITEAVALGFKKADVEVALAYDGHCVTGVGGKPTDALSTDCVARGIMIARPGIGYPSAVHLERFSAPSRILVTDDPRMATSGGCGMLVLVGDSADMAKSLAKKTTELTPPCSLQVLFTGKMRPFVCARDVALELLRRGLKESVEKAKAARGVPVVVEFSGPSVRLLSVAERAVIASLAPHLGAMGCLFASDERTEVHLRDQRRSKAHRVLGPDQGATFEEVITCDLGAVDPLVWDEGGTVRSVRDVGKKPVAQVVLGGDSGVTVRDMLAAALLLKSKRVPPHTDFLVAVPSRQMLEILAQTGALADLAATGARFIEPDARVTSGELYPPREGGLSVRTSDVPGLTKGIIVGSAETLAYAVAYGETGDPRSFKRPVRVTVPRELPTDDVLVLRGKVAASR
jgi:aconitate hydratase